MNRHQQEAGTVQTVQGEGERDDDEQENMGEADYHTDWWEL